MTDPLTGSDLRGAARRLRLSQKAVARVSGVSLRTVSRLFNSAGPLEARPSTVAAISSALGLGKPARTRVDGSDLAIELPLDALWRTRHGLPGLFALVEAARITRDRPALLDRLGAEYRRRTSVLSLRDSDLYFDWIGEDIRWAGEHAVGARPQDIVGDPSLAQAIGARYWKALFTGEPIYQYVRVATGLEFAAVTVATGAASQPRLITISALGRPPVPRIT
jgi:transcriptional regulator with XRE-family HTH domain